MSALPTRKRRPGTFHESSLMRCAENGASPNPRRISVTISAMTMYWEGGDLQIQFDWTESQSLGENKAPWRPS